MNKSVRIGFLLLALLLLASIIPNLGIEINTFGFYWNFFRLVVVLSAFIMLILFRGEIRVGERKGFLFWIAFFGIWLLYGGILLVASPYSDKSRGVQELFSVFCALLVFYCFSRFDLSGQEMEGLLRVVFFLLTGLILFGFYEILTANHLSTSMFADELNLQAAKLDPHTAAGIMYNINDFSALLTILCPVTIGRFRIHLRRIYLDPGWLLVLGVIMINRINDANICNAALIAGILTYFLVTMHGDRRKLGKVLMGLVVLLAVLVVVYISMGQTSGGLVARWQDQMDYMNAGGGSLHARILIYRDALLAGFRTGFLGVGPGGFPVYCEQTLTESSFVNPHSFLLEIFSEYGLLIFLLFVILIGRLICSMFRLYQNAGDEQIRNYGLVGLIMLVVYLIASFAPSSFILNAYQWGLLALLVLISEQGKKWMAEEKERTGYAYV
ncbi:MAG: hypothetical protein IKQ49_03450 [Eubacterium sp.]|nr:hypothetical protein [Eubacterium sp.]